MDLLTVVPSKHSPNGTTHFFNEKKVSNLVLEWQLKQDPRLLDEILSESEALFVTIIKSRGVLKFEEMDEVLSRVRIKIWKGLKLYDPARGRIFSFLNRSICNVTTQIWKDKVKYQQRYESLTQDDGGSRLDFVAAEETNNNAFEDMEDRVRRIRTVCTDLKELEAQRWLVKSFFDSGFLAHRHEMCNATMICWGLSKARSRELHDQTLLEIRRTMLTPETEIPVAVVRDLTGPLASALIKYKAILPARRFDKLVFLMRGLSPIRCCRIDRSKTPLIISDLDHILDGFPGSRLLFD